MLASKFMKHYRKIKRAGFTLIEMLIIVGILVTLAALIIPNALKARMSANDVMAQATLKTVAGGMENYFFSKSRYPADTDDLVNDTPPYVNKDYFTGTQAGFIYEATLNPDSYVLTASPSIFGKTGSTTYTITTGGVFQ